MSLDHGANKPCWDGRAGWAVGDVGSDHAGNSSGVRVLGHTVIMQLKQVAGNYIQFAFF